MPRGYPAVYRAVAVGCALLWAAFLGAQPPQPRPPRPVYLINFEGGAQPGGLGDLAAFATTTLRLRLSAVKSLEYLSSQAQTPCRQSLVEGSRSSPQGIGDSAAVPIHYLVSGSVDVRDKDAGAQEIDLSYSLDEVEHCQVKNLLQSRVPMAPAEALARFRSMGDVIALRLEEELSDREPVAVEPVATSSADEKTRGAARLLQQLLEGRLADSDDFRSAGAASAPARPRYRLLSRIETKAGADGRRIDRLKFRIETDSKAYDLPPEIAPADQAHGALIDFFGDAAESALRALAEIRYRSESGLPDDPTQVETSLVVSKAENYLRQGKPSAALALFSGIPASRQLSAEALAVKGHALFQTADFPAAARVFDDAAAATGNAAPLVEARMLYGAGAAWYRAREYSTAAERYDAVLTLSRAAAEPAAEVKTMIRESARWRMASLGLAGKPEQALAEYVKLRPLVEDSSGLDKEARGLLDGISSIQTLRRMIELLTPLGSDSPVLQRSWQRVGDDFFAVRDFANARKCYENALSAAQKQVAPDEHQIARLLNQVGNTYFSASMTLEAIPYYETAIKKAKAGGPSQANDLAVYLQNLASGYQETGANDKAESALKEAKKAVESVSGVGSPQAAVVETQLGNLYADWGKHGDADPLLSDAVAILEKQSPRNDRDLVWAYMQLGWLRWEMDNARDAEALFRKAQAILDSRGETATAQYGVLLDHLSATYALNGDYAQSLSLQRQAVEISKKLDSPSGVAHATFNLCSSLTSSQSYREAASECEKVQSTVKRQYGTDHWLYAYAILALSEIRGAQAMFADADKLYNEGYRLYKTSPAKSEWRLLLAQRELGQLRYWEGRYTEALGVLNEILKPLTEQLGTRDSRVAETQILLGWTLLRLGLPQAQAAFQAAVQSFEARGLPDHPTASSSREGLGRLALANGDVANAEALCKRSLDARLKSFGYDSEDVADSLDCMGLVSTARGAYPVAAAHFQRALAAYEKNFGPQHPKIAETLDHFAALRKATGDTEESARLANRATAIRATFRTP